jgi:recombination protein RecA
VEWLQINRSKEIIDILNKAMKGDKPLFHLGSDPNLKIGKISSGMSVLDRILGGGWPRGRVVMLIGAYSSGKTLACLHTIASAQREGCTCAIIDAEKSYCPEWSAKLGIQTNDLIVTRPNTADEAFDHIVSMLRLPEPVDVIVLDSIASLTPTPEREEDMEQQFMGLLARTVNKGLRKVVAENSRSLIMMINQTRESIGVYMGNPETWPGGKGQGFTASTIVRVKRGTFLEEGKGEKKKRIGHNLIFRTEKNKMAPPYQEAEIPFYYSGIIDYNVGVFNIALELGIINRAGPYYKWKDNSWLGRDAAMTALEMDENLIKELKYEVEQGNENPPTSN